MATREQTGGEAGQEPIPQILLIPNEITSVIFIECVHDLKETNIAITISHVCRHWRSIALFLPSLWQDFWYTARKGAAANARAGKLLDLYLERSQSQLLHLGFDFREVEEDEGRLRCLKKALPHVARWRRLTILASCSEYHATHFFLSHLQTLSAPHLQYLALASDNVNRSCSSEHPLERNLLPTLFKGGAPNLTFLWMDVRAWPRFLPPLLNITTLLLEEDTWATRESLFAWAAFVEILSLPALSNLSLKGKSFLYPSCAFGHILPVVMQKLKHLRVDYDDAQPLLLSLRAPLLETLVLHNIRFIDYKRYLWAFIQPDDVYSFPSLHSLVLKDCYFSVYGASYLSQMASQVKDVIISCDHGLSTLDSIGFIWPQLEVVTLNLSDHEIRLYIAFTHGHEKKSLKCRIHRRYLELWSQYRPFELFFLHSTCTIEEIPPGKYINEAVWPPDSDGYFNAHNETDHFAIPQVTYHNHHEPPTMMVYSGLE